MGEIYVLAVYPIHELGLGWCDNLVYVKDASYPKGKME